MGYGRSEPGWLSTIIKTGRWYLFSSLATKALALLTLTMLTHSLSPAEFGALNTLTTLTQALPIVLSLYMDSALARLYHEYRHDRRQLAVLYSTAFWFVLAWGGGVLVAFSLLVARLAADIASVPLAHLWIATVPALLLQLAQLGLVFLRQSFESWTVTKIDVWGALIGTAGTYVLVMLWDEGVLGRLWAMALSSACVFAYVIWHFARARLLVFRFDQNKLKECLVYSLPLLPNLVAGWVVSASDRLIIAKYVNLEAVGVYSLAATIASLLYVVQDAVTQVTGVKTQVGMSTDRVRTLHMISELTTVMWAVMLFVNYCAVAYSVQVVQLFTGKGYEGAASLIGACGFVYVVSPQNRILQDIISFHRRTLIISSGAVIMGACSLTLNFLLIPHLGYTVAPYVLIISLLAQTAWLYGWVNRYEKLTLQWSRAILAFGVFSVFIFADQAQPQSGMVMKFLFTAAYALITYAMLRKSLETLKKSGSLQY